MEKLNRDDTGYIMDGVHCTACGWPVVYARVCDKFRDFVLENTKFHDAEWWAYCLNKGCDNHQGEEISQENMPYWAYGIFGDQK